LSNHPTAARLEEALSGQLSGEEIRSVVGHLVPGCTRCCAALLERSWPLRHDNPKQMVQLAELAVLAAGWLAADRHGGRQVRDLQCRAAVELANAYRVAGRLDRAQGVLDEAMGHYRHGSRDVLLGARLFEVQACVFGDRRSFAAAFGAFDDALATYRRLGRPLLAGRVLISTGVYAAHAGDAERAIALIEEGLALLPPHEDPRLALAAVHEVAETLLEGCRFREARRLIWRHRCLGHRDGGQHERLRLTWLEGRLFAGLGHVQRAERALDEARRGMTAAGKPYPAAVLSLELAALLMRHGREEEARRLALEAAEVFLSLDLGCEAAVAMMLLKSILRFRIAATAVMLEEMARFMRQAEKNLDLRFF
jgi:tetratricopeptide (TPR) repeat protein